MAEKETEICFLFQTEEIWLLNSYYWKEWNVRAVPRKLSHSINIWCIRHSLQLRKTTIYEQNHKIQTNISMRKQTVWWPLGWSTFKKKMLLYIVVRIIFLYRTTITSLCGRLVPHKKYRQDQNKKIRAQILAHEQKPPHALWRFL